MRNNLAKVRRRGALLLGSLPLAFALPVHGPATEAWSTRVAALLGISAALWWKLRTTKVIERCFVEVRRSTRPTLVFTNVESVDRIVYAIFSRFNEDWKNHTSNYLHKRLDPT